MSDEAMTAERHLLLNHKAISPNPLMTQLRVIHALMLRAVRSRLFGNGLGFIFVSVIWPMGHVGVLVGIYLILGRAAPVGDNIIVFFATGLIPYIAFNYIARLTMVGVMFDRALLIMPIVKVVDLVLARAIVELLGSCLAVFCLLIIIWLSGSDPMPRDFIEAAYAYGAAVLLGFGLRILNAVIALVARIWLTFYLPVHIILWASCGMLFVPDNLPEKARYFLSFNPVLQAVEWMRSAYYPGYGSLSLDKTYLVAWGVVTIFVALVAERLVRGKVLGG